MAVTCIIYYLALMASRSELPPQENGQSLFLLGALT